VLYIADGHHRAKGASRVRKTLQAQDPHVDQSKEYNFFQCVIFPDNQIQIFPYNRIVTGLNHRKPEELLHALEPNFEISKNVSPEPKERGQFYMYLRNCWYGLRPRHQVPRGISLVEQLDVAFLHDKILAPILGIEDMQTTKQIDFIGGVNSIREIERLVDEGRASVGFSLFPTSIDELLSVADAGEMMPPKSTWFEPKLRDGILIHLI
jgi:uncharacterized protein (DUF1015 family)